MWRARSAERTGVIGRTAAVVAVGVGVAAGWTWLGERRVATTADAFVASEADLAQGGARVGVLPEVRYGRDVRPILADRCFLCHGPDEATRAAGLRLDERASALGVRRPGGRAAVVPGDVEGSELWRRILAHDEGEVMPPPESGKRRLSDGEAAVIRAWIEQGAVYEAHWAFVPPVSPVVPAVQNSAWVRNPIDHFIAGALESAGLGPSGEADRATLLRRVFLDLTGLPPTVEELDAFLRDRRPDAYERWVDRLLSEEPYVTRYAEHMASFWLDQARYADTSGIHTDAGRSIWPWRDWVLRAYRSNLAFDRFVIDQLAGDLIPGATIEQVVATGFNRNHVTTDEGGAIAEEYLVEYAVDRVSTVGSVFLGLTLGCARCHDHKYDPVGMGEFYGLMSFFNSIEEPGLYSQETDPRRAFEPFMAVATAGQSAELARLSAVVERLQAEMVGMSPEEEEGRAAFVDGSAERLGVVWELGSVERARSEGGATVAVLDDGSVLVGGTNPARDVHEIVLTFGGETSGGVGAAGATERSGVGSGANVILLEALADPSLPGGRVGRNGNGNAVLTGISAQAESIADPTQPARDVRLVWAWADHEQQDGDFAVINAIELDRDEDENGWAVDAHRVGGNRVAMFLADGSFGFEGGTRLTVRLEYGSIYAHHALGRVRVSVGSASEEALSAFPEARGSWFVAGPFGVAERAQAYRHEFGPERGKVVEGAAFVDALGRAAGAGAGERKWTYARGVRDGVVSNLEAVIGATYVGRRVYSPTARRVSMSLGSDDGLRVYVNGAEVFGREVDRGVAPDQDRMDGVELRPGMNTLVLKVANTGGASGVYWRAVRDDARGHGGDVLDGVLVAAVLPAWARWEVLDRRVGAAWLESFSPRRRELAAESARAERELAAARAQVPTTMVMKELPEPRATYVLTRGQYDLPDLSRPAVRGVPAALGVMEPVRTSGSELEQPRALNRLDLARWLMSSDNPLTARVTVNRLWAQVFGQGIVRTTDDFGLQGDWPSHPELLDWLAVRFREEGWDVRAMLRLMVTSATYRQSSRVRQDVSVVDPENRLLAFFPRERLSAEQVRDQALYVSGLLVERLGGPSVRPYQPAGLWEEVAMPQSNTRNFVRGQGEDLWRRSLYTYWKRASPPPAMLAFDAPTRESCVVQRGTTNTPLQALALWNDEQMVEAARALAARVLGERALDPTVTDSDRLGWLYQRVTGTAPDRAALTAMGGALAHFRERYASSPESAAGLLGTGEAPLPMDIDRNELAAWTMVASAVLSSDAAITRD